MDITPESASPREKEGKNVLQPTFKWASSPKLGSRQEGVQVAPEPPPPFLCPLRQRERNPQDQPPPPLQSSSSFAAPFELLNEEKSDSLPFVAWFVVLASVVAVGSTGGARTPKSNCLFFSLPSHVYGCQIVEGELRFHRGEWYCATGVFPGVFSWLVFFSFVWFFPLATNPSRGIAAALCQKAKAGARGCGLCLGEQIQTAFDSCDQSL